MQAPAPNEFLNVPLEGWLTILAILVGPLAALLIQKRLERGQARTDRKVAIFRALMSNRASRLSAAYVQALNGIETEFYGETAVIEAWRGLVDHLYSPHDENNANAWNERVTELLNDLLYEMAEALGYHFDKVTLKRNVYYPSGWNIIEEENTKLRKAAVEVFEGRAPLKVAVIENPSKKNSYG
jgi:hypothetical protein